MFIRFGPKSLHATTDPMQESGNHGLAGSIMFRSASIFRRVRMIIPASTPTTISSGSKKRVPLSFCIERILLGIDSEFPQTLVTKRVPFPQIRNAF